MKQNIPFYLLVLILVIPFPAMGIPDFLSHQGRITGPDNTPLSGSSNVTFNLHTSETGGSSVWTQTMAVTFDDGYYSVLLGPGSPSLSPALFDDADLYLGITVEGSDQFEPRHLVATVPYSFRAGSVTGEVNAINGLSVDGHDVIDSSGNFQPSGSFTVPGGDFGDLPSASNGNKGQMYYANDEDALYYSNGSEWVNVSSGGGNDSINMPSIASVSPEQIDPEEDVTIAISGQNLDSGCEVWFGDTRSSDVEYVNSSRLNASTGAELTSDAYNVMIINLNGLRATSVDGLIVDARPVWVNEEGSLGFVVDSVDGNHFTLEATDAESQDVTYSVISGGLPDGLSMASDTGVIYGDPDDVDNDTEYQFEVRATDTAPTPNQVDRTFAITIIDGVGLHPSAPADSCNHVFTTGTSETDGIFWVDSDGPGGADAFEVYCHMMDGGGWTVVARYNFEDGPDIFSGNIAKDGNLWSTDRGTPAEENHVHNIHKFLDSGMLTTSNEFAFASGTKIVKGTNFSWLNSPAFDSNPHHTRYSSMVSDGVTLTLTSSCYDGCCGSQTHGWDPPVFFQNYGGGCGDLQSGCNSPAWGWADHNCNTDGYDTVPAFGMVNGQRDNASVKFNDDMFFMFK